MKTAHRQAARAKPQRRYAANPAAVMLAIWRRQEYTAEELVRLKLPIRAAYDELKAGRGTQQHWADLSVAVNTSLIRAESIHPLVEQTAIQARDALVRMRDRYMRTGRWGFDGPGIGEVLAGVELHEELLDNSTPQQMLQAGREARKREEEQVRGGEHA